MKLQCALFLAAVVIQVENSKIREEYKYLSKAEQCAAELNLDISKMPDLYQDFYPIYEDDADRSRFLACIWGKRGIINEDGEIDTKVYNNFIRNIIQQTDLSNEQKLFGRRVLGRCGSVKGDSAGITGIRLKNCFSEAVVELYAKVADQ